MVHDILVKVGENSTIPCLVTDPAVAELGLETCDGHALPEGLSYRGSLEQGVIISHTQKAFEGCYACTGRLGGNPVRSDDFTLTVRLDTILTAGQSITVLCSTTNVNNDFSLSWISPRGEQLKLETGTQILPDPILYVKSMFLHIASVRVEDSGTYLCKVNNERGTSSATTHLDIRGKPLIISREGPVDGQVRCVAEGYPTPEISWYYCDQPHTRCSHLLNATQEQAVSTVMVSSPEFGRREVESRVNISRSSFATLECVATAEGQQAYTLFSIRGENYSLPLFPAGSLSSLSSSDTLSLCLAVFSFESAIET
ncbi:hypothetical protein JZ751_018396 [Albula glossodonta]|uniref:Ig-like domain-containing protein n=1 Tax=Albula glossodonta TaxID=121402 RepID=A0A8T2MPQ0_9TELE|nr:hypothetical protein JZ751_018396 [Albula glossodonta]